MDRQGINPELARERAKATIDPEQFAQILYGDRLAVRRKLEKLVEKDEEVSKEPEYHFMSRPEHYSEAVRKAAILIRIVREHKIPSDDLFILKDILLPNEELPCSLNVSMFIPMIETQGSEEQKAQWLQKAANFEIIGTYAQTELGHGSNVRGLETTAVYDPEKEEFILNSPTITSTKFWPGGLGKTSNYAVVMAGLYSLGKYHGIQAFVVPLRDLKTHMPLPGITVGDIGPKFGYESMDNGFLRFNHVRIPRQNMLMKNAQVLRDGSFVRSTQNDKLIYLVMLAIRSGIVWHTAAQGLAQAVTIAIRYSCVRHQSELKPGDPEPQIIEYQLQQFKLFPLLATAYAYWFSGMKLSNMYTELKADILKGSTVALPELHATSAGLKAFSTAGMMRGIEQCRLACGGHGYSQASGIPKIYVSCVPACTYEGENTVLLLQTARYLAKSYREALQKKPLAGNVSYLSESLNEKSSIDASLSKESLINAYRHRAARLVAKACTKLAQTEASGVPFHEAWNKSSIFLVQAAEAHCHYIVVKEFADSTSLAKCNGSASASAVLTDLFKLYAVHGIWTNVADFIEDGYVSVGQLGTVEDAIVQLLDRIRPNAVALVDSFNFSDRQLGSVLGRFDGQVYENLYKWAASSPLNKTEVHESQRYLQQLRAHQAKL